MKIDPELRKIIDWYIDTKDKTDEELSALSLYHDLSIYGDDVDEFFDEYMKKFHVEVIPFCFSDYFRYEGGIREFDNFFKILFGGKKKEYKRFTVGDLQRGINEKILKM